MFSRLSIQLYAQLMIQASLLISSLYLFNIKKNFRQLVAPGRSHFLFFSFSYVWFCMKLQLQTNTAISSGGFFKREGRAKDHEVLHFAESPNFDCFPVSHLIFILLRICNHCYSSFGSASVQLHLSYFTYSSAQYYFIYLFYVLSLQYMKLMLFLIAVHVCFPIIRIFHYCHISFYKNFWVEKNHYKIHATLHVYKISTQSDSGSTLAG